jgi:hypothetical protein
MTATRLAVIATVCILVFDWRFGSGQLVNAAWDQAARLGYWLNDEFASVACRVARVH